jgi:hypothetical protein
MPVEPVAVDHPPHPLHALATFELDAYRHQLEHAIAYLDVQNPVPPARHDLQARLDAVLAEQHARAKLARF